MEFELQTNVHRKGVPRAAGGLPVSAKRREFDDETAR